MKITTTTTRMMITTTRIAAIKMMIIVMLPADSVTAEEETGVEGCVETEVGVEGSTGGDETPEVETVGVGSSVVDG